LTGLCALEKQFKAIVENDKLEKKKRLEEEKKKADKLRPSEF